VDSSKTELDDRFNEFYDQMEKGEIEDEEQDLLDEEDPEIDEDLLDNFAGEYMNEKNLILNEVCGLLQ
jgi:hypothetical protein